MSYAAMRQNRLKKSASMRGATFGALLAQDEAFSLNEFKPTLPYAMADTFLGQPGFLRVWTTIRARESLAQLITASKTSSNPRFDKYKSAILWGELTASWLCQSTSVLKVQEARNALVELMKDNPPKAQNLISVFKFVLATTIKHANDLSVDKEEVQPYWTEDITSDTVAGMKFWFYKLAGHALPWDKLVDVTENLLNFLNEMCTPNSNRPAITEMPVVLLQGWEQEWRTLTIDEYLAFYEALGESNYKSANDVLLAAYTVSIISLAKGETISSTWLTRRLNKLLADLHQFELQDVDVEQINKYHRLTVTGDVTLRDIYIYLMTAYNSMAHTDLECLTWIIEQSSMSQLTHMTAFARYINDASFKPLGYLLRIVGKQYVKTYCIAALMAINSPYNGLKSVDFPAKMYADLANIGVYGLLALGNKSMEEYKGKFVEGGQLAKHTIISIVGRFLAREEEYLHEELKVHEELSNEDPTYNYQKHGTKYFRVPKVVEGEATAQTAEQARYYEEVQREFWPASAQSLPTGSKMISNRDLSNKLDAVYASQPGYKEMTTIINAVNIAGIQKDFDPFTNDKTLKGLYVPIDAEIIEAFQYFVGDVTPYYTNPTSIVGGDVIIDELTHIPNAKPANFPRATGAPADAPADDPQDPPPTSSRPRRGGPIAQAIQHVRGGPSSAPAPQNSAQPRPSWHEESIAEEPSEQVLPGSAVLPELSHHSQLTQDMSYEGSEQQEDQSEGEE
ncbi:TPA_asm: nucleoprotein [Rhagovelia obesa mononega-like virus]|uniref:Nucleoprotein n=1 Tax=Rhagovelia obesa mononega-like virus TaxID=2879399 RepID=A0AAV2YEB2_9VIRU|nr:nucleoprotein [Rhagovelia obesa mononega-like virus]DAZ89740.1 TPA_asm: nucleoprotein [Rhagovelia obesa mononega-like virus]